MAGAFIDDAAGVTTTEGLSDPVISGQLEGHNPIIGYLVDGATYAYKQIFVDQVTNGYDYENCEGVYDSGTNTLTKTVLTSSNNDAKVDWLPGDKAIYIVANSAMLGQWERALGNPGTNGYVLSSTTAGVRSWIPPGVATWGGIIGTLSAQTDLQTALEARAPLAGGQAIPKVTVIAMTGNSQAGGFGAGTPAGVGDPPVPLTGNPNVYVWQAATSNTQTAAWENADYVGPTISVTPGQRTVGFYKGQVGTQHLAMANKIQESEGGIVLVIPTFLGGAPSDLFNPSMGDTDSMNDFNGDWSTNNNMWYWHCTAINNALAAAAVGTGLPDAYAIEYVDISYFDISSGNAIYTSAHAGASRNMEDANTGFVTDMLAFIGAAEGTSGSSAIGGWAKQWKTRWYSSDVPAGTEGGAGLAVAFGTFDGNARLFNACQSLLWTVPSHTGLYTTDDSILGTSDQIHRNAFSQVTMGEFAAKMWLNTPQRGAKQSTGLGITFTGDIDALGYDITGLGVLGAEEIVLTIPTTLTANNPTGHVLLTGAMTISGAADAVPIGLRSDIDYTFNVSGNSIYAGGLIYREDTITAAGASTTMPSALLLTDVTVFTANGVNTVNGFGMGLSAALTPRVNVTGGGTVTIGPSYPSYTFVEGAILETGVTSAMHVGFHSRNVTHTGTVGLEAQVWLNERTSAAQNVALLIGGTLGTVPTVSADFAMWQVNTTPWRFNGAMTLASGDFSLTSGQINVNSAGYSSDVANSGTNVAHKLKTPIAFSGTTKIVGLTNNGTDVLYFANDGAIESIGNGTTGTLTLRPDNTLNTERLEVSSFLHSASIKWIPSTGAAFLNLETAGSNAAGTYVQIKLTTQKTSGVHTQLVNGAAGTIASINYLGAPGFWGATPVTTKATAGVGSAGNFVGGGGTTATSLSTWSGGNGTTAYTVNDLVRALKDIGILVL